jgi:hypothetical protein
MGAVAPPNDEVPGAKPGPGQAIYRITLGWRIVTAVFFTAVICAALAGVYFALTGAMHILGAVFVSMLLIVLASTAVWALVEMFTWRVTFMSDTIEASSYWRTRRLRRDEIKGCRFAGSSHGGRVIVLVPNASDRKKISLALRYVGKDAVFFAWFDGLRNLDAEDLQNSINEIAANAAFGATPKHRLRHLGRARKLAWALDIATFAAIAWCFVAPRPYALLIATLAAIPVLAFILVVLSRGLFRIDARRTEAHANLGTVFALPGCALLARMLLDLDMVNWIPAVVAAVVGGIVLVAIMALVDRSMRARPWALLGCSLLAGAYSLGLAGEANALLDHPQLSVFRSQVMDKYVTSGKATRYHLRLAPWGPREEPSDVTVPHTLYDRLLPGNLACVLLHQGAFGMPWFIVVDCR